MRERSVKLASPQRILGITGGIVGLIVGAIAVYQFIQGETVPDISGEWHVFDVIERTENPKYMDLELGFKFYIQQEGIRIWGEGEKWWENREAVPSTQRTPIKFEGTIDGRNVAAGFTESGLTRQTRGRFEWVISDDGRSMTGTFRSTAADTRGSSQATWIK